jgi:hypothetical protein
MKKQYIYYLIVLIALVSCHRVVLVVEELPANTPTGEPVYIAGNFNKWDPGASRYQLEFLDSTHYYIALPSGFGRVEYKFTRGDWRTVETDRCGLDINNRSIMLTKDDTIYNRIESWHDLYPLNCEGMVILIDRLPENTPGDADIYFVSNQNNWSLWDKNYLMRRNADGTYELKIPKRNLQDVEFKFTRGSWSTQEVDEYGFEIENRVLPAGNPDMVRIQVANWKDLSDKIESAVTLIVTRVPDNTPPDDPIYVAGNFNGWKEHDELYQLERVGNGTYRVNVPRQGNLLEFKFNRGYWETVEVARNGRDIDNRTYQYREVDTLELTIERWHDR